MSRENKTITKQLIQFKGMWIPGMESAYPYFFNFAIQIYDIYYNICTSKQYK